jgi:ActR/RegA family two-component response regulator
MPVPNDRQLWLKNLSHSKSTQILPSLGRLEWDYIQLILQDCRGNISESARRLGLHRRTLQRKLRKLPPLI